MYVCTYVDAVVKSDLLSHTYVHMYLATWVPVCLCAFPHICVCTLYMYDTYFRTLDLLLKFLVLG